MFVFLGFFLYLSRCFFCVFVGVLSVFVAVFVAAVFVSVFVSVFLSAVFVAVCDA